MLQILSWIRIGAATGLLALLALPPGAASAATIPFNEALTWSYNPDATGIGSGSTCCDYINIINAGPPAPASTTYDKSGAWGSVHGSAAADLATGQLRMRASASYGDGSAAPAMQVNAMFGDGFRTTTAGGQPFVWATGTTARFSIALDGVMDASRPLDSEFNPDLFVILSILAPGTLDPSKPLINGPTAQQYFYWNIGNPDATIYYTDQDGNSQILTATEHFDSLPGTLTADFNIGSDFDWVLLLGASGQLYSGDPGNPLTSADYFDFDLSHTLTMSYAGPADSVTRTISGQFGGFDQTTDVPEPASALLLLGALAALGGLRWRG